jgi:hypothetical protein
MATLTPEIAKDLMMAVNDDRRSYSEFDKYGGYEAVTRCMWQRAVE